MLSNKQKKSLIRIVTASVFFVIALVISHLNIIPENYAKGILILLFLIPYAAVGGNVILKAVRNIMRKQFLDENFLMVVASLGAFFLGEYPEAVAVMLFYQVGALFEDIAVNRSRESISKLMDICPETACVEKDGEIEEKDPDEVEIGDIIVVKPGERVPLDGEVIEGHSTLNMAALTGESMPMDIGTGENIVSGSVNLTGLLKIRVTKAFSDSTVSKVLELVENAADRKSKAENFITKFARYYTPAVVGAAVLLAIIPSLFFAQPWATWIERALIFLVVSCPCALVISIPMSFFGGIAGASRRGVLIKGGNYLDVLAKTKTLVFDKTGTLTKGSFEIFAIHPEKYSEDRLMELAAYAEYFSNHPISSSIREAYKKNIHEERISDFSETAGKGVSVKVDGLQVLAGNEKWMDANNIQHSSCELTGTIVHLSVNGEYAGHLHLDDKLKPDVKEALSELKKLGVQKTVMLTGDKEKTAAKISEEAGLDEYYAELLPQDKVSQFEKLMKAKSPKTHIAFVGDGINDAPVLALSDVGIAMGAVGSDAAIEAADIVLMNDKLSQIVSAMRTAQKTMRIVWQNIILALGIKGIVLLLAAIGLANMWLAVFADVGVAIIAILNAMRALRER